MARRYRRPNLCVKGNPHTPPIRTICSWCNAIIVDVPEDSRGLSHGVCPACYEGEMKKIKKNPFYVTDQFNTVVGSRHFRTPEEAAAMAEKYGLIMGKPLAVRGSIEADLVYGDRITPEGAVTYGPGFKPSDLSAEAIEEFRLKEMKMEGLGSVGPMMRQVRGRKKNPFMKGSSKMWFPDKGSEAAKDIGSILGKLRKAKTEDEKLKFKKLLKETRTKWIAREEKDGKRKNPPLVVIGNPPLCEFCRHAECICGDGGNLDDEDDVMRNASRQYHLFEKKSGRWSQVFPDSGGLSKDSAVRIYQNLLLMSALGGTKQYAVRPIPKKKAGGPPPPLLNPHYITNHFGAVAHPEPFDSYKEAKAFMEFHGLQNTQLQIRYSDDVAKMGDQVSKGGVVRKKPSKANPYYITDKHGHIVSSEVSPSKEVQEANVGWMNDRPGLLEAFDIEWPAEVRFDKRPLMGMGQYVKKNPGSIAIPKKLEKAIMKAPAGDRPELIAGIKKYYEFHDCFPSRIIVKKNVDHAKAGYPKVNVALGKAGKVEYQSGNPESNKFFAGGKGVYEHKFGDGLRRGTLAKPLLVTDPTGKTLHYLPSRFKVKDWIHH